MDISTNPDFLAGALSTISQCNIVPNKITPLGVAMQVLSLRPGNDIKTFNMDSLHKHTLTWVGELVHSTSSPTDYKVVVQDLNGRLTEILCKSDDLIETVKIKFFKESGVPVDQQRLVFGGKQLEDGRTLADYNIKAGSHINFVLRLRGGGQAEHCMDPNMLDPGYNFDFTNLKADNQVFKRGDRTYQRPLGWNRVAFKVKNRYEDDIWLGGTKGE